MTFTSMYVYMYVQQKYLFYFVNNDFIFIITQKKHFLYSYTLNYFFISFYLSYATSTKMVKYICLKFIHNAFQQVQRRTV